MKDYKTLRKRALITDFICIIIAAAVLYCGTNYDVPAWVLFVGLFFALVALIVAIVFSFKARKIERAEYNKLVEANKKKAQEGGEQEDA